MVPSQKFEKQSRGRPALTSLEPNSDVTSPTVENGILLGQKHYVEQQSLFFQRLPPEIRRIIIVHAFGERTIHVFREIRATLSRNTIAGTRTLPTRWIFRECADDYSCEWKFSGSRCVQHWARDIGNQWSDRSPYLHTVESSSFGDLDLGVMGWLLSCYQSYHESIDIIFRTNTFYLSGDIFFDNSIGERIREEYISTLKQCMSSVRSLELALDPILFQGPTGFQSAMAFRTDCDSLLLRLPVMFPSIRKLQLNIGSDMCLWGSQRPVQNSEQVDIILLSMIAEAVNSIGWKDINCELHLPHWLYRNMYCWEHHPEFSAWEGAHRGDYYLPHRYWKSFSALDAGQKDKGVWMHPFCESPFDSATYGKLRPEAGYYSCCRPESFGRV